MKSYNMNRLLQGLRVAEVAGLAHTLCSLHQSCEAALSADVYLRNVMADLKDLSDRILDALRNNRLICWHTRSYRTFPLYITEDSHLPEKHRC